MLADVAHDGAEVVQLQPLARQLAVQRADGRRWLGLGDRDGLPVGGAELGKGGLGQPELAAGDDGFVIHHVQRGEHRMAVGADLDLGQGLEALGPVHRAVAVHVGDVLVVGVDQHAAQGEPGGLAVGAGPDGARRGVSLVHGGSLHRFRGCQ